MALTRAIFLLISLSSIALAAEPQEKEARQRFVRGQSEFAAQHYQAAYDLFKEAYLLAPQPAFLYNMASALQALGHPGQAADKLRAYLRATGNDDPDRPKIEDKIRALDEAQRLLDAEARPSPAPVVAAPAAALQVEAPPPRKRSHTTAIAVGISVAAAVVLGVGLGVGLGLRDWHSDSTLHTQKATP